MNVIDLRSDTLTKPTPGMRHAMAEAEVGDDVYGEDPTVRQLQERVANLFAKEAALFVPSGTMGNQLALRCQTSPGDEILAHEQSHIRLFERGAPAVLSGVTVSPIPGSDGVFTVDALRSVIRAPARNAYSMFAPQTLLALENTHNAGGGTVWPDEQLQDVVQAGRDAGMAVHLDGARLWNAAAVSNRSEAELAAPFDTLSVCFSKGLGAPIGSILIGSTELIGKARRFRGLFGGAMRQVGIIAAACLHALDHHRARLAEDHDNARRLADGLAGISGIDIAPDRTVTNIIMFRTATLPAARFVEACRERGLLMLAVAPDRVRAVTHLGIAAKDIDDALTIAGSAVAAGA